MKKLLLVVLLAGLLGACGMEDYAVLGYCEADETYYYTYQGEVQSTKEPGKFTQFFDGKEWCPVVPETEKTARPLFQMQLFENYQVEDYKYCIIFSDGAVAVELQQLYCGWVADNHTCGGWVYDNDSWECDHLGFARPTLDQLLELR